MFVAQICNKLSRSEEDMEDLLTGNVFGVWRYLPAEVAQVGLLRFLKTACRLDSVNFGGPDTVNTIELKFWPWIQEGDAKGAEPDVLIEIVSPDLRKWLVLVEAKYLSPKSSFADEFDQRPNDQLAREMQNLRTIAEKQAFDDYALVYVTAHTLIPRTDIEEAVSELTTKIGDGASDKFYWTTWRRLPNILSETISLCKGAHKALLDDLQTIILRMGLYFFTGMSIKGWTMGSPSWSFRPLEKPTSFKWVPISMAKYSFEKAPARFSWVSRDWPGSMQWRWKS